MKYKKYSYILVLILMLLVGMNGVEAKPIYNKYETKTCYYINDDGSFKTRVKVYWDLKLGNFWNWYKGAGGVSSVTERGLNDTYTDVIIDKIAKDDYPKDHEAGIHNWLGSDLTNWHKQSIMDKSVTFPFKYDRAEDANKGGEPSCPKYLVFENHGINYRTWVTDSFELAQKAQTNIRANGDLGYYGSLTDSNTYWQEEIEKGEMFIDEESGEVTCADYDEIFGSPDDPESIRYLVNQVLQYVRIIVPILIILLGTLDLAKAVIAGREDNMRKAQADFVKRLLIGVAVFFIPLVVDIVMELADIVWEGTYPHCGL